MDWQAVRDREKEVVALWKPRSEETPPRYACYDCVSDFIYQFDKDATAELIRLGRYGWDEPDKTICLCAAHRSIRQAGEEKWSLARLDRLQTAVANWGKAVFPDSNAGTISDHLAEEMVELLGIDRLIDAVSRARDKGEYQPTDDPAEESADILLLLCHLADRLNYSLMEATLKKFAIVQDAEWKDDGRGYKKRVKP